MEAATETGGAMREAAQRFTVWRGGYPVAVTSIVALALLCLPLRGHLPLPALLLLFVPVIVALARVAGSRASVLGSVVAVLAIDVLFVEPYYRLTIADPSEWIALAVFLVVSVAIGRQTALLREREQAAVERQRRLLLLNRLSTSVVSEKSAASTAMLTARQIVAVLGGGRAALYVARPESAAVLLAEAGDDVEPDERRFVDWVLSSGKAIGLPADLETADEPRPVSAASSEALPGHTAQSLYLPLQSTAGLEGVLVAREPVGRASARQSASFLIGAANIAATALERERLQSETARLNAEREADRLKSTLVSSVSHELKTPLAAATARISGLLDGDSAEAETTRDELVEVQRDLGRLNAAIGDLLDVSRLESDAWRPKLDTYDVPEILGSVLERTSPSDRERVTFELPETPPAVHVDFTQIARAVANVVGNALQYSPPESPVTIGVGCVEGEVLISVSDRGPGVIESEKARIFEKFYRGAASARVPSGTGLGLAIASEIVRGHGGRIWVEDSDTGGARFVIALPQAEQDGIT